MHKRLREFLEINNVIHSLQFGFRRNHSTAHALISLTERINPIRFRLFLLFKGPGGGL